MTVAFDWERLLPLLELGEGKGEKREELLAGL